MSDTPQGPGWWLASDGKWYPPQPTAPPPAPTAPIAPAVPPAGYGPPPQPNLPPPPGYGAFPVSQVKSGMSGCLKAFLIVLAIVVVLGLGSCVLLVSRADDIVDEFGPLNGDEARDAGPIDCRRSDATGNVTATFDLTNRSSETSNYIIAIEFTGSGDQTDTVPVSVDQLDPGETAQQTATSFTNFTGDVDCRLIAFQRISSDFGQDSN